MDLLDNQRTTVDELNARIQAFYYGKLFKCDKLKILMPDEVRNRAIPTKATQIQTFYKLAPFILKDVFVIDSPNYEPFKLMRRIIMYSFSKKLGQISLLQLERDIVDFLTLWNSEYADIFGFVPNHHFLTHLVEDIKLFGHPTEFSCMRHEAKHQQFKRVSKKKQGFKNHQKTLIETYIGGENIRLRQMSFLKPFYLKIEENDKICVKDGERFLWVLETANASYKGLRVELRAFDMATMCYRMMITDQEIMVNCDGKNEYNFYQIIEHDGENFLLFDEFE